MAQNPTTAGKLPVEETAISNSDDYMHKFYQEFKPGNKPLLVSGVRRTAITDIDPRETVNNMKMTEARTLNFHLPPYTNGWRRLDGRIRVRYKVRNSAGTAAYDPAGNVTDHVGHKAAIWKPYGLVNMWKSVNIL